MQCRAEPHLNLAPSVPIVSPHHLRWGPAPLPIWYDLRLKGEATICSEAGSNVSRVGLSKQTLFPKREGDPSSDRTYSGR